MEFDDIADSTVEHVEARRFLNHIGWFGDVDQVEDRS